MTSEIHFFNTLSGKDEKLTPIDPKHLTMYVCGPTVYDRPHLGNARSIVIYDLLFRFLQEVYPKVTYVRNITDVDDKINAAATQQGVSIQELTQRITDFFYKDIGALNVLRPTFEPKATEHITEVITMIQDLIKAGHAYESKGHVLFSVKSYKDYGKLSNRNLDEMISGSRIEIGSYKKDPLDFVLWKPAAETDDKSSVFDSPWSQGRPGWHIECSAMSSKYLGANFDIHGGGADLQFPHHENEIAQSCCANEGSNYANLWIHNGFLTVDGEKMSKSLKNFITVRDLLDKGVSGVVIRYLLLSTHYRKPFDFNQKAVDDAQKSIDKFYSVLKDSPNLEKTKMEGDFAEKILGHLSDDLNVSKVMASLHEALKSIKSGKDELKASFIATLDFLGLLDINLLESANESGVDEALVEEKIALRIQAKKDRDFATADSIRDEMLAMGIVLEDVAGGKTIWKNAG